MLPITPQGSDPEILGAQLTFAKFRTEDSIERYGIACKDPNLTVEYLAAVRIT